MLDFPDPLVEALFSLGQSGVGGGIGAEVGEAQERRIESCHAAQLGDDEVGIEVGRRSHGLGEMAVWEGDAHRVPDEAPTAGRIEEHDVVLGVARGVEHVEGATPAEPYGVAVVEDEQAVVGYRLHRAPQCRHPVLSVDPGGRRP